MSSKKQAAPVRLLHLSDFHFVGSKAWDADPVLRALAHYIGREVAEGLVPDLVVITGDLAFSGRAEEYVLAREWLQNQLWPVLRANLTPDRLLLVPGNHDVDRAAVGFNAKAIQTALLKRADQGEIAKVLVDAVEREPLLKRHTAYQGFLADWLGAPQPLPWWQRNFDIRGTRLHVAGLDSAFMAHGDTDRGNLLLGHYQLNQTVLAPEAEGADWRLALLHHPWDYLAEFDAHEVRSTLHQHCDLLLRGHLHSPQTERILPLDSARACLELAAGCVYENSRYPNAFQWIELYREPRRVKVLFRIWQHGEWMVDRNRPGCPEGEAEFPLARPFRPSGTKSGGGGNESSRRGRSSGGKSSSGSTDPDFQRVVVGKVAGRLEVPDAAPFQQALRARLSTKGLVGSDDLDSAAELADFVAQCPAQHVQDLFWAIRWAMAETAKVIGKDGQSAMVEAAVALYCLAACRAVEGLEAISGHVFKVRHTEPLICAVIAAAFEGRELRLKSDGNDPTKPQPSYVFTVHVPAAGNRIADAFERAAYLAVFPRSGNQRDSTDQCLDDKPLTPEERDNLEAELGDISEARDCSRALVVHGLFTPEPCHEFAERNRVPTMLPDAAVPDCFAGISANRLKVEICKFWQQLDALSPAKLPAQVDLV